MINKTSNILTTRNGNQNFKDLFKKKLKDRNKQKGYCFSYNFPSPILDHSYIQNILYSTYYDISKKIFKENEFKFAFENYKELKRNISSFEQKYKDSVEKEIKKKNNSYEKINYTNLNEIFKDFLRDKNKHIFNKNSIIKSKLKIDNISKTIRKNRIKSLVEKISLGSKKIKTKVDMGKNKNDNYENSYKKLIDIINTSRRKLKLGKKINYSKLDIAPRKNSLILENINNIENINKLNKKEIRIKANLFNINNPDNRKENINESNNNSNIQKQKYKNIYNNLINEEGEVTIIKPKLKINLSLKKRPFSYSRNQNKLNHISNINTNLTNTNSKYKRFIKSSKRGESPKVINKPLYTSKIEDVLNEYHRIKNSNKKTEMKYKERHYLTFREIDNIMKTKDDLQIFDLQQRFFKKKFPKPIIKKKNKKELFIKKFIDDVEFLDKDDPYKYIAFNKY